MDPKAYWVGFNLVKGIGAVRLKALLDFFGSLEIAWQAPAEGLRAAGLASKNARKFPAHPQGLLAGADLGEYSAARDPGLDLGR